MRAECKRKAVSVTRIYYMPTPDAESRLSRAIDILLDAATRITTDDKDSVKDGKKPAKVKNPVVL